MFIRLCPKCGKELSYTRKDSLDRAIKNGTPCFDCVYNIPIEDRFWKKVDKSGECWIWNGAPAGCGYGGFTDKKNGRHHILAHRFSWEIHYGSIPDGMLVCHKCDTPKCVNPQHLFLGTQSDNIKDCFSKKRNGKVRDSNGRFV